MLIVNFWNWILDKMQAFDFISDEDEDILDFIEYKRRPYVVRERLNPFEIYDDVDFCMRFRLSKETVLSVSELIENQIETITNRNHCVSPINQLLLALRFYATGNFLISVGDTVNVSKITSCRIVKKVSQAIASLAPRYIYMPLNAEQIAEHQMQFYNKARLPRVIGSIDCTHIRIQSPGGDHAEVFRNRKGFMSINVQTISSANLKIQDIVARWPGSTHDQNVFDNSNILRRLHENEFGNSILVGDSGYANTTHVITPLLRAITDVEQLYNEAVRRTRNPVERQYGNVDFLFYLWGSDLNYKIL